MAFRSGKHHFKLTLRDPNGAEEANEAEEGEGGEGGEPKYPNVMTMSGGGVKGGAMAVKRVMVSKGLAGQWEILSLRYRPPMSLRGKSALDILQKVWSSSTSATGETMSGTASGLGFLFLYDLFQGRQRCKIVGSTWSMWGSQSAEDRKTDSHRFAILLSQLYTDRKQKR